MRPVYLRHRLIKIGKTRGMKLYYIAPAAKFCCNVRRQKPGIAARYIYICVWNQD